MRDCQSLAVLNWAGIFSAICLLVSVFQSLRYSPPWSDQDIAVLNPVASAQNLFVLTAFQVMAHICAAFWDLPQDTKILSSTWSQTPWPLHQLKAETKCYLLVFSNHRWLRWGPQCRLLKQGALPTYFPEHAFITRKSMITGSNIACEIISPP